MKNLLYIFLTLCILSSCKKEATKPETTEIQNFALSDTMLQRVAMETAMMQKVKYVMNLNGKVIADESKMIEVFPLVGGNVTSVTVELGDYVGKNQILSVIRSGETADLERQLIDAESDLIVAKKNQKVQEDLFSSRLSSERDVLSATEQVKKAEAELNRVREIYKIYNISSSSEYVVKAPISGFIIEKNINRDMTLRSDKSDNIFTIAEINEVWITANVYESEISKIKLGMETEIRVLSYPDKIFKGKVDKIFNVLDPISKTMKIRIKLPNVDYALKPEMVATVKIFAEEERQAIAVPTSSIIFDKSLHYVVIYKSAKELEVREVEIDKTTNGTTYLKSGVNVGEKVVSKNQLFIYDALTEKG
jgi:membrane fusion protein, heavy metal efflux system